MHQMKTAAIVLGALLAVPVVGSAQTTAPKTTSAKTTSAKKSSATHSTHGVVKSMDASTLVIEQSKTKKNMTFAMDDSTHKNGDISVGSTVEVRYKTEASKVMALEVQPVKQQPAAHKAAAK